MKVGALGLVALFVTLGTLAPTAVAHDVSKPFVGGLPTSFTPADMQGHVPVYLVVAEVAGGGAAFAACQDLDGNLLCGEQPNGNGVYEPWVGKCGTVASLDGSDPDHAANAGPFSSTHAIHVVVRVWDPACPDSLSSSGMLTLVTDP